MANQKTDLSAVTINQLCELTGKDYRSIKKFLKGLAPLRKIGRGTFYDPQAALPLLYEAPSELDPAYERARKDKEQADKLALENARIRGEVVDVETVKREWTEVLMACRAKLIGLPVRMAQAVAGVNEPREAEEVLRTEVYGALTELSAAFDDESGDQANAAAATSERQRVGGKGKGTQSRGQRRTGKVEKREGAASGGADGRA